VGCGIKALGVFQMLAVMLTLTLAAVALMIFGPLVGLSSGYATVGGTALMFVPLLGCAVYNRLTIGTWTRPISPQQRAELRAYVRRRQRDRLVGLAIWAATLPIVWVMVDFGYNRYAAVAAGVLLALGIYVLLSFVVRPNKSA